METQMIPLNKIAPEAIKGIRSVRDETNSFQNLREAIRREGQLSPIIIRRLATDEIEAVKERYPQSEAEYGIIDGQNRFYLASFERQDEILATILDNNTPQDATERKIADTRIALNMNSAIPMSVLQKGKVIYDLEQETGRDITELGLLLFNVKSSMAYRYVQEYKKHKDIRRTIKKREKAIDAQILNDLAEAWNKIPHEESAFDFNDAKKCMEQIDLIKDLENKLGVIRRVLLAQDTVKEEIRRKKVELAMNVPLDE